MQKSNLFKAAWAFFKANIYATFSEALTAAWVRLKAMQKMSKGWATIKYRKSDGSITERIATTSKNILPGDFSNTPIEYTPSQIRYFDQEANGWRSFKIDRFISIV